MRSSKVHAFVSALSRKQNRNQHGVSVLMIKWNFGFWIKGFEGLYYKSYPFLLGHGAKVKSPPTKRGTFSLCQLKTSYLICTNWRLNTSPFTVIFTINIPLSEEELLAV